MKKKDKQIFFEALKEMADENDIQTEDIIFAVKEAAYAAARNQIDKNIKVHVEVNEEENEISTYLQYFVVENLTDKVESEYPLITLEEAKLVKKSIKVGQVLDKELNLQEFSIFGIRDFRNKFKEVISAKQKEKLFKHFKDLEGTIIRATVLEEDEDLYKVDIGKNMQAFLYKKDTLPNDKIFESEKVNVLIVDVKQEKRWAKVIVSRTSAGFVKALLEQHIPEISDGIVEIMGIGRIAGERTKVCVKSNDEKIPAIGSCIGKGGARINGILQQLHGEKIDVFEYSNNEKELISNSLKPAEVLAVTRVKTKEKSALAIVADGQLSLAIGKAAHNVKLAVEAIGWSIDIKSETIAEEEAIIWG